MIEVLSPCKINLFLYITDKRADGFHNLQSLFCLLEHGDKMRFEVFDDNQGRIELDNTMGMALEDNLIYKAVKLLQEHCHKSFSVNISIDKVLPMGGGLGGGSSNAATTLLVVNKLANLGIKQEKIEALGAKLGSDVPFFVGGHNAYVEGRGEILSPQNLPERYYLVVTPDVHVSTKDVFTNKELKNYFSPKRSLNELLAVPFGNDCISIVRKNFCEIGHTLDSLVKYGNAAMSGTGASCFVAFDDLAKAHQAQKQLQGELKFKFNSFVAKSINCSPVIRAIS